MNNRDHRWATSEVSADACLDLLAGVSPQTVAKRYGFSPRTAYRWRRDLVSVEVVRVDGWAATFARRHRQPPVRISAWEWSKVAATRTYRSRLREQVVAVRRAVEQARAS